MLFIKRLDFFLQSLFPIIGFLVALFFDLEIGCWTGVFGLAFSQIMSAILHLPVQTESWYEYRSRRRYFQGITAAFICGIIGLFFLFASDGISPVSVFCFLLVLVSGFYWGVFYMRVCWKELVSIRVIKQNRFI